jgi:CheY-like chemotaxis protein
MGLSGSRSEVMVVEDDLDVREILREILEDAGYSVSWAANGREALARLKRGRAPRLILLDLMMPVMDGREFRTAQQQDPSLAPIPVVVISADHGVDAKIGEMQVDAWLTKPFEVGALLATVDRYC